MLVFVKPDAKTLVKEGYGWVDKMDKLLGTVRQATSPVKGKYYVQEAHNHWTLNKECLIEIPEGHIVAKVKENFCSIICDEPPRINSDMRKMAGNYYLFKKNDYSSDYYYCKEEKNGWSFHKDWLEIIHEPNSNKKGPTSPSAHETMKEITTSFDLSESGYNFSVVVRNNEMFFRNGAFYTSPWNNSRVLSSPGQAGDVVYKFDNLTDAYKNLRDGRCLDKYKVVQSDLETEVKKLLSQGKIVGRVNTGIRRVLELSGGQVNGYSAKEGRCACIDFSSSSKFYTFDNHIEMMKWLTQSA